MTAVFYFSAMILLVFRFFAYMELGFSDVRKLQKPTNRYYLVAAPVAEFANFSLVWYLGTSQLEVVIRFYEVLALQRGTDEQTAEQVMLGRIRVLNICSNIVCTFAFVMWLAIEMTQFYDKEWFDDNAGYFMSGFFLLASMLLLWGTL